MRKQREKILFEKNGKIARWLFYGNAIFWLFMSLSTLLNMIDDGNQGFAVGLVGFFLLMNVLALFFGGKLLDQTETWTYIFAIVVALLNTALAFTGVPDIPYVIAMVIDVITLLVLISLRSIYFK